MLTFLDFLIIFLCIVHFGVPLAYYRYLRGWLDKPWNLILTPNYEPKVSVIVPTYNEQGFIWDKLSDIAMQNYPMDKVETIVVDSASTDQTVDLVEAWKWKHPNIKVKIIREQDRAGKARALNFALKHVKDEIVVVTDGDSHLDQDSLKEIVKWLSHPSVGAVTGIIETQCRGNPTSNHGQRVEYIYRSHFNIVRVAESKIYSTPVFNGPLMAFRRDKLLELGGFPLDMGADDSYMAALIALKGHRSICVPDAIVYEPIPTSLKGYISLKGRRGIHLVHNFSWLLKNLSKASKRFKLVVAMEAFLHLVNPWLLLTSALLFALSLGIDGLTLVKLTTLALIVPAMAIKRIRRPLLTWITNQLILVYAAVRSIHSRELSWKKIAKK